MKIEVYDDLDFENDTDFQLGLLIEDYAVAKENLEEFLWKHPEYHLEVSKSLKDKLNLNI